MYTLKGLLSGLSIRALAATKPHILTRLDTFFLKSGITIFGSGLDFQLSLKIVKC